MPRKVTRTDGGHHGWEAVRAHAKELGICRDCSIMVPKGYLYKRCPPCRAENRESQRACRERDIEKYRAAAREANRKARRERPEAQIIYRNRCRDKAKADTSSFSPTMASLDRLYLNHVRRKYGLDAAALESLLNGQDWCCSICATPFASQKEIHIDHCHKTGRVRGVLCQGCNTGLGLFRDDRLRLTLAAKYLERHGSP